MSQYIRYSKLEKGASLDAVENRKLAEGGISWNWDDPHRTILEREIEKNRGPYNLHRKNVKCRVAKIAVTDSRDRIKSAFQDLL